MTVKELRRKYLDFFQSKGHMLHPSGSLVPYDVTGKLDESLLFNGAGMVQFKPYFRGIAKPPSKRLTNCQKVVRTGDIEEVGDPTHLTFFEMLGNFSFGDYFKAEAIAYSWEFMTSPDWLGLDPHRLSFTVFEEDDEAYAEWSKHLTGAGIDATNRIFRLSEETNFWPAGSFSKGPPGPCGPNTEMFYWTPNEEAPPTGPYGSEDYLRDEAAGKWLEIWNDVFIQYEWKGHLRNPSRPADGYEKDGLEPLPFKSVDTGMGLERTSAALAGIADLYRIDSVWPIVERVVQLGDGRFSYDTPHATAAIRIIADHIRTSVFCIADGILPGNSGRGYVLRRLIRRAVLKGQRVLGFEQPFFHLVFDGVLEAVGDHYKELHERKDVIVETLQNEERLFRRTLASGYGLLQEDLQALALSSEGATRVLAGSAAFRLYDTYGFPLEVTQELAAEAGVEVDVEGYEQALQQAQERSRAGDGMANVYGQTEELLLFTSPQANTQTEFLGYDTTEAGAHLVQISPRFDPERRTTTGEFQIVLDRTPFYAESGGQIGDTGTITGPDFEFQVTNTWKEMGLIWHDAELIRSATPGLSGLTPEKVAEVFQSGAFFKPVKATVDAARRRNIVANHTATHLLHAALRQVLGKHVTQAGSLVAPDHLRFDFTHGKTMSPDELAQVEKIVNEEALMAVPVTIHNDISLDEARAKGAMALFGEKYGDRVRMVEVPGFSLELCGGCHVRQTSEVGLFKIVSESSAASGIRRIEALTGEKSYEWVREQTDLVKEAAGKLKTSPNELVHAIEKLQEQLREERKRIERLRNQAASAGPSNVEQVGSVELAVEKLTEGDIKEATLVADRLVEGQPKRVALVALAANGKATIIAKVGPEAQAQGAHAGNLVREVAKLAGGGGGGRPDFATAGAKDMSQVDTALAAAKDLLQSQLAG